MQPGYARLMISSNTSRPIVRHRNPLLHIVAEFCNSLWREEEGQDLVEYSLLLGCISLASMAALGGTKSSVLNLWQAANKNLSAAVTAAS